jgi:hypothetical protein
MKSNHFPIVFSKSGCYSHRKLYIPKPQLSNSEENMQSPISHQSVLPTIAKFYSKSPLLPRKELPFAGMSRNISARKSLGSLFKTNEAKQDIKSAMGMIRIKDFLRDSRNAGSTNILMSMRTEDPSNYGMTPSTSTSTREVCFPYISNRIT